MTGLGEEVPRGVWKKQSDPQVRLRSLTISFVLLYCGIRGAEVKTVSRFYLMPVNHMTNMIPLLWGMA